MDPADPVRRGAVVALKPIERAKSRLGTVADPLRRQLAWAMAVDTLSALSAAVEDVVVVSGQPSLAEQLHHAGLAVIVADEPGPLGMNAALTSGADLLRARGCALVLACVADLPALRASSVRRILAAALSQPRSYLADASGVGTTMLLAVDTDLEPHFQGPSAAAHLRSGAAALTDEMLGAALPDARQDVDTEADLSVAADLGLGPATSALLHPAATQRPQTEEATFAGRALGRKLGR